AAHPRRRARAALARGHRAQVSRQREVRRLERGPGRPFPALRALGVHRPGQPRALPRLMRRLAAWALGLTLLALVPPAFAQAFRFGLIGDLAYSAAEEPLLQNVLDDLAKADLAFVVHLGDLGRPSSGS